MRELADEMRELADLIRELAAVRCRRACCRVRCSASSTGAEDRYGQLPSQEVCKHTVRSLRRLRAFSRSNNTCGKNQVMHAHALGGAGTRTQLPMHAQWRLEHNAPLDMQNLKR